MSKHELTQEEFNKLDIINDLGQCENLINKTFNELTVISYAGRDKSGKSTWYCKCSCGNPNILGPIIGSHIKNGKIKSCGCLKSRKIKEIQVEQPGLIGIKSLINGEQE